MASDPLTSSDTQAAVPAISHKKAQRRIVWLTVILLTAFLVAGFDRFQAMFWPSELEREIQLDLVTGDSIEKDDRVFVLKELKLFRFYSRFGPQRFATLCLQKSDDRLHLAFARCWRDGMLWRTDADRWKPISDWPTTKEIKSFEDDQADLVARAMDSGYRSRPPGTENFVPSHLSIRVSENISAFAPNTRVDRRVFANVLKHAIGLDRFAYAKFHEPHWHSPNDGIAAIEKSITHLQQISGQPENRTMDCERLLTELHTVKDRLIQAEEFGLGFYFLATDGSGE